MRAQRGKEVLYSKFFVFGNENGLEDNNFNLRRVAGTWLHTHQQTFAIYGNFLFLSGDLVLTMLFQRVSYQVYQAPSFEHLRVTYLLASSFNLPITRVS